MSLYNDSKPRVCALIIEELKFAVKLGCTADERATPQEVRVSIELRCEAIPLGAFSDSIEDTICFAKVNEVLKEYIETREFNLIERIGLESFGLLRELTKNHQVQIGVRVHKVQPPIPNLIKGAHFTCGDFIL
ncbi:MAG: dihydroneopterin aldolase [Bdellovibrionota bacterium]